MFSIPASKMHEHLKQLLTDADITQVEFDIMTRLVSTMQLHTFDIKIPPFFDESQMLYMFYQALRDNMRPAVLDRLGLMAISSYMMESKNIEGIDLTNTLCYSIASKFHQLAHYLLDNNLCMMENYPLPEENESCTTMVLKTKAYDKALFEKIVKRESHINVINEDKLNALLLAILTNNEYAVSLLLQHPQIILQVARFSLRLVDYSFIPQSIMRMIKAKVQDPNFIVPLPQIQLFEFPVSWLSASNQDCLRQFINKSIASMPIFQNEELRQEFERFLNAEQPLPFNDMNRVSIALDCILYLKNPKLIHQNGTPLCGVACVMQHLLMADPIKFIHTVIDMAELGHRDSRALPKHIKTIPKSAMISGYHVADLWLQTVRNAYNVFLNYDETAWFQDIRGLTRPHHMALMYRDFGFQVQKETSQVRFNTSNRVGQFFDSARRFVSSYASLPGMLKVYSLHHEEIPCDQARFENLRVTSSNSKYITILLTSELINKLTTSELNTRILNIIDATHYVTLTRIEFDEQHNTVSFDFMTWGECFSQHNFPADEFKRGFMGLIAVDYDESKRLLLQLSSDSTEVTFP